MPADGRIQYSGGSELSKYKLPICDVQKEHRNFEGVEKNQWYSLGELQAGIYAGNTETDSKTETSEDHAGKHGGGYAGAQKSGKGGRSWKSSSPRKKGN
ncbi:MAG: hypothetical protein KGI25_07970 [Thaumarchaeota archaeon]|nr:hypothetical protein [Nitrososphaerota archaeon]